MSWDPGEGTSDGRVKRTTFCSGVEIKEENDVKVEPMDIQLVSSQLEVEFEDDGNREVKYECETDDELYLDYDLDPDEVKEEMELKESKMEKENDGKSDPEKDAKTDKNDDENEHKSETQGRKKPKSNDKISNGSRKNNKRNIPRSKAAIKMKKHKCQWCQYVASCKSELARHTRTHTGDKPFECDICSKTFSQKSSLTVHMKIHSRKRPVKCSICLKSFTGKIRLNSHSRIHQIELKFECSRCGHRFAEENAKNSHENQCQVRLYACYLCQYISFDKTNLQRHLATHREQFPYQCVKCQRGFREESEINSHRKICRYRQYQCYMCNKFERDKINLKIHMNFHHTGERPFSCKRCGARFISKWSVKRHMKNVHKSKIG